MQGTVAQGFIGQNRRNQYEKELKRGMIYTLTNHYQARERSLKEEMIVSLYFQITKDARSWDI